MYNETGNYNPYTTAPTTAHILWTKPVAFGGTIGGEFGGSETSNFYSTAQYEPKFAPIIINGILYYTMYPGASTNPAGWEAVNLQTGQTIWTKNTTEVLVCGQILNYDSPNQYGGLAYLWSQPASAGGYGGAGVSLEMWDAMTGNYILSISGNPPLIETSPIVEDEHGDLLIYYINYTDNTLNMWNSTKCINLSVPNYAGGGPNANNWMWRPPQDAVIPFSLGIEWSAALATNISGSPLIDYAEGLYGFFMNGVTSGVVLMNDAIYTDLEFQSGWVVEAGYSAVDGHQLWMTNRTEVPYTAVEGLSATSWLGTFMGDGVYVDMCHSTLSMTGYSVATGQELWGPETLPNASPFDSLGACAQVANGTIYVYLYGGDVYAYNIQTGALEWQYHTPSGGLESPYGTEPIWVFTTGTVAGGLLFVPEGHMYSPPLFHGAQQLALNITNGHVVWTIDAFDVTSAPAVSDGVMTTLNSYDNQIYAWGMGPSKTTVAAPNPVTTVGSPIVLEGTVMDISAGSQQEAVAANFPNGLPCVSDASMTQFMEAVYMQQPMPTNVTGVPVTISVADSNGNHYNIGTATTNANGFYSLTWTPIIPGNFTVTATFAGTQSYYGSSANTAFYASASAPTASPYPSPVSGLASFGSLELGIAAVIIVIVIVGVAIILTLRRRP
jgi:hypothetical protein